MRKKLIFLYCLLISFQSSKALDYSLKVNLSHYLELLTQNNSAVENKTTFPDASSLSDKKGGVVKGTIYEKLFEINKGLYQNIVMFDTYDDVMKALKNHSIDYFICYKKMVGEIIQIRTEDLTYIDDEQTSKEFKSAFLMAKNPKGQWIYNNFANSAKNFDLDSLYNRWIGIDKGFKYIDRTEIPNPLDTINFLANFNQEPYSYIDENGEKSGLFPQIFQKSASLLNINFNILESYSRNDCLPSIENGTADLTCTYFLESELDENKFLFVDTDMPSDTCLGIRYQNSEESKIWFIWNSVGDFNGESIGTVSQYQQDDSVIKNVQGFYTKSEITLFNNINDLMSELLRENQDGAVVDIHAVKYYQENSDRIDYYSDNLFNNSYGILFKEEDIKESFNKFLSQTYDNTKRTSLFNEWKNADTDKTIEFNTKGSKSLFISFEQSRPLVYMENGKFKGYELALLEEFAAENDYRLIVNESSLGYSDKAEVILGYQNITGAKAGNYFFSDSILDSYSVLAIRKDGRRENLDLTALDKDYKIKADNILDIPITVGGQSAVSKCKLPSKFSEEVITLECSASGLSELRNLAGEEIEFGEVTDRINILYTSIKADNLVKANKLFPGENVISTTSGTNEPESPTTTFHRPYKKSSSGLSAGTIVAIVIPCCAVLAAAIIAFLCMKKSTHSEIAQDSANSNIPGFKEPVQKTNVLPNTGNYV